jgi:hypothetical protein
MYIFTEGVSMTKQLGLLVFLGMLFSCMIITPGYGAKDQITVSCYLGDPSDNRWVGEVKVFDVNKGRGNCNMLYDRCEGGCTPCYRDEDGKEICIDASGNPYFLWE